MTGRELIMYILANGLEDEPVYKNGKFIGFVTPAEVASKNNVGFATVYAWIHQGRLDNISVQEGIYIPANYVTPLKKKSV